MMKKMQHETIKCMDVKQEALDDIYGHFDEFHKTTVWKEECRSWFKDGKVKNRIYLWPGSVCRSRPPCVPRTSTNIPTDNSLSQEYQRP